MATGLMAKYQWSGGFDQAKLIANIATILSNHVPGYGPEAPSDALRLITRLATDNRVTDLRAMAYMLATAARESKKIKPYVMPQLDKAGAVVTDKKTGLPLTRQRQLWTVFQPIEESGHGAGLRYHDPVKVARIGTGALVTERDGEQFDVAADGTYKVADGTPKSAQRGSTAGIKPKDSYTAAPGDEFAYFGRGLVQLTWWNSYASAGIEIGQGLELLFDPDRLLDFETSYQVMILGMLFGKSFANGHKCSDYFTDSKTDYVNARDMVNSKDKLTAIVNAAQAFEDLLLNARLLPKPN